MRIRIRPWLFGLVAISLPAGASADPVTILNISQFALSSASLTTHLPPNEVNDLQHGSDSLVSTATISVGDATTTGTASLFSSVSTDGRLFSGTATTSATELNTTSLGPCGGCGAGSNSQFIVDFQLSAPQQFTFTADVAGNGRAGYTPLAASWSANLVTRNSVSGDFFYFFNLFDFDARMLTETGVLPAGRYNFMASTGANATVPGTFSVASREAFSFSLSDVGAVSPSPEPATMVLLASGLVIGGARRFRVTSILRR